MGLKVDEVIMSGKEWSFGAFEGELHDSVGPQCHHSWVFLCFWLRLNGT